MSDVRLMTVDPGHFHAALVQKEMYPGVAARVDVYAPLGADLYEHLKRIDAFNRRAASPTTWSVDVHASPDYFERMLRRAAGQRRRACRAATARRSTGSRPRSKPA